VLDAWSRRIVGWAMATHLRTELVLEALNMALTQRRTEVIHHSDQGCQYTSFAFGQRCDAMGVRPSMGSVGDAYDNAMCERFFATLECDLIDRGSFKTQAEARMADRPANATDSSDSSASGSTSASGRSRSPGPGARRRRGSR